MGITEFLQKQAGKDTSDVSKKAKPRKRKTSKQPEMDITSFLRKLDGKEPLKRTIRPNPLRRKKLTDKEKELAEISKNRSTIASMEIKTTRMIEKSKNPFITCYLAKLRNTLLDGYELLLAIEKGETDEDKLGNLAL